MAHCSQCRLYVDHPIDMVGFGITRNWIWYLCPPCAARWHSAGMGFSLAVSVALVISAFIISQIASDVDHPYYLLMIGLILPSFVVATILHELGHVLTGWLSGWTIYSLQLGTAGTTLYRREWGRCQIFVRSVLLGGGVTAAPWKGGALKWRKAVFVFGGPILNSVTLLLMFLLIWSSDWRGIRYAGAAFLLANLVLLLNLVPFIRKIDGQRSVRSDGLEFLMTLRWGAAEEKQVRESRTWLEASYALRKGDTRKAETLFRSGLQEFPGAPQGVIGLGQIAFDEGRLSEARALFLEAGLAPQSTGATAAVPDWQIAMIGVLMFRSDLLSEADRLSAAAMARTPWDPHVAAVRGAVLAMRGQRALAADAIHIAQHSDREQPSALVAVLTAVERWCAGNRDEALAALARAQQISPHSGLLPRIAYQLGESPPMTTDTPG